MSRISTGRGHRFCLAAPGDFKSTPKITEFVALGAVGGCLPVLVLTGPARETLPYTGSIDWCEIAYLIDEKRARTDMASILIKLQNVTEEEATAKRTALLAVRDAFVWRPPAADPVAHPSAADFLLGELCAAAARKLRKHGAHTNRSAARVPAPYSLARCML